MSIEAELIAMGHSVNRMATAMEALTDEIHAMTVTNQKVLMILLDLVAGDEPDAQPQTDLDGNPV